MRSMGSLSTGSSCRRHMLEVYWPHSHHKYPRSGQVTSFAHLPYPLNFLTCPYRWAQWVSPLVYPQIYLSVNTELTHSILCTGSESIFISFFPDRSCSCPRWPYFIIYNHRNFWNYQIYLRFTTSGSCSSHWDLQVEFSLQSQTTHNWANFYFGYPRCWHCASFMDIGLVIFN